MKMTNYQLDATILGVLKAAGYGKHVELVELLASARPKRKKVYTNQ